MLVKKEEFCAFLETCARDETSSFQEIILPAKDPRNGTGSLYFARFRDLGSHSLDGYRPVDPLKMLFYGAREQVMPCRGGTPSRIIAGVKACDLEALSVLDRALINDDFVDPVYKNWRQETVVISSDCTDAAPSCHCTLVGGRPYVEAGFDMNLSTVGDSYFVTTGSGKGEEFLALLGHRCGLAPADSGVRSEVETGRREMLERVKTQNAPFLRGEEYDGLKLSSQDLWRDMAKTCVGCGACTNICPTCYCLILNDESESDEFLKVRSYDSCQWHGYARVAAGASPRPFMHERFRNRYLCKFLYMKSNFGRLGCTGCGRCTDACPGGIEFRAVVQSTTGKETPVPEILRAGEGGCDGSKPL